MKLASSLHELKTLLASYHPLVVIETFEEQRARRLAVATAQSIGTSLFEWSLASGLHYASDEGSGHRIGTTGDPAGVLKQILTIDRVALYLLKDFAVHLEDPAVARLLREVCQAFSERGSSVILTGSSISLPADLQHHSVVLPLELPDAGELASVVRNVLDSIRQRLGVALDLSIDEEGEEQLVGALRGMTLNQARQAVAYAAIEDGKLDENDLAKIQERKARTIADSGLLEYFPAADNAFELGGFDALIEWVDRAEQGFSSEAAALNLTPPKGVMMVGVQGCGKSLAAKAIARRWKQPLLKLDAGSLYNKYIGESEKNLRRALELAESMAPVVLWIDEIEKAFATSSEASQDGGLSRRLHGSLLTWLQEKRASVFVVATANDVLALPPELMRKGRFDEIFFVDLPKANERERIFAIHLEQRKQDPSTFEIADLVFASDGFSGAEIEQAVISALYRALHEGNPLDTRLLLRELDATVPLSHSRREDIERLRAMAAERFVPVSVSRGFVPESRG